MTSLLKRLRNIFFAGFVSGLPGGIAFQSSLQAPLWYTLSAIAIGSMTISLMAMVFGGIALIAARDKDDGGAKVSVVITAVAGLFISFTAIYPFLRS